jgi:hypothetical protein
VREAIVASIDADLWNGGQSWFEFRDTNGNFVRANVIGRRS